MKITSSSLRGLDIQSNLNASNTDGSFTIANSNAFLSPFPEKRQKHFDKVTAPESAPILFEMSADIQIQMPKC